MQWLSAPQTPVVPQAAEVGTHASPSVATGRQVAVYTPFSCSAAVSGQYSPRGQESRVPSEHCPIEVVVGAQRCSKSPFGAFPTTTHAAPFVHTVAESMLHSSPICTWRMA
jgi:hypothetical protein